MEAEPMALDELAEVGVPRKRGRGFPTLPLDQAADAVRKAGRYGKEHSEAAFAGYLGHSTTNSGGFKRKMAAMKDWGFIRRERGRVVLTDLANQLAHPESAEQESLALRTAFFEDDLFARVYADSAKGTELSVELLANRAVNGFGVSPQAKPKFMRSFVESAVVAGLATHTSAGDIELIPLELEPETAPRDNEVDASPSATSPALTSARPTIDRPPTIHEEWKISDGRLIFEAWLDRPVPAAAYADISKVVEAMEQLVAKLGAPAAVISDDADPEE
jgi:hypothetical protein